MREKIKTSTNIIYVRHGKTDFPLDRLYCDDKEDPPLNEEGLQQAQRAAQLLESEKIDAIYASPMQRTQRTAEEIIKVTGAPLYTNPALKERPFGIWDGLYFDAIAEQFPEDFKAWKQNPVSFVPEGGETIDALLQRVKNVVDDVIKKHRGQTIVVVTHVGPIRVLLADAIHMPIEHYRQLTVDYASLSRVDYGARQNNFIYMNRYLR